MGRSISELRYRYFGHRYKERASRGGRGRLSCQLRRPHNMFSTLTGIDNIDSNSIQLVYRRLHRSLVGNTPKWKLHTITDAIHSYSRQFLFHDNQQRKCKIKQSDFSSQEKTYQYEKWFEQKVYFHEKTWWNLQKTNWYCWHDFW